MLRRHRYDVTQVKINIILHVGRDINVKVLCFSRYYVKSYVYTLKKCKYVKMETKNVFVSNLDGHMKKKTLLAATKGPKCHR